jgi:hypothetical protein
MALKASIVSCFTGDARQDAPPPPPLPPCGEQ